MGSAGGAGGSGRGLGPWKVGQRTSTLGGRSLSGIVYTLTISGLVTAPQRNRTHRRCTSAMETETGVRELARKGMKTEKATICLEDQESRRIVTKG